jgi:hypothetical protein
LSETRTKAQAGTYVGGTTPRQSGPRPCMPGLDVTSFPWSYKRESPVPLGGGRLDRPITIPRTGKTHSQPQPIETWELVPLSIVCNPYYELSAYNTSSGSQLDVGTFRPNQYISPCPLCTAIRTQTHNPLNLLVGGFETPTDLVKYYLTPRKVREGSSYLTKPFCHVVTGNIVWVTRTTTHTDLRK